VTQTELERYAEPRAFAREVNLPLLGDVELAVLPAGSTLSDMLRAPVPPSVGPIVESLVQTRQSLTLRSLLLAGYAHDPELFALGLALAREWTRRGLKAAVVDLNFWSPSIVRPPGQPNEGLVDMLEFGCSFRRVAWEAVADRLWLVGPGSYLPEEECIAEHPDWERVTRVLSNHADLTIYVAPHLERGGFLGRLTKRMDGVLLASAVTRVPRARLRDSFLELWGSDAPMIGCLGITPAALEAGPSPVRESLAVGSEQVPAFAAESPVPPKADVDADLAALLEREALSGGISPAPRRARNHLGRWLAVAAVVLVAGGAAVLGVWHLPGPARRAAFKEATPTGTEPVLPAQLGTPQGPILEQPPAQAGAGPAVSGPSVTAAPPAALPFRIHVASFRSEATVQRLAGELTARGLEASYEPAPEVPGWYRVFVGRFATYEEAASEARRLVERRIVDRAQAFPEPQR
jgi:hypothetical protein